MQPDFTTQAFQRLDALADKLGVALPHLWAILVRQAYVSLIVDLICAGIFVFLAVKYGRRVAAATEKATGEYDSDGVMVGGWLLLIGTGIVGVLLAVAVITDIAAALNPEYYALQQVLKVFRSK